MAEGFTLKAARWYAMTMYPGYADKTYRSPIEVHRFETLGNRKFRLTFWNIGYAEGVQNFVKDYRTLHRHADSLIVQEVGSQDRLIIFEPLTGAWIGAFTPIFSTMLVQAIEREQVFSAYQKPRDTI